MCGFVGFSSFDKNLLNSGDILEKMNNTLKKRGPDEEGYYKLEHIAMGHKRLIVIDPEGGKQPMIEETPFGEFSICYNGQLYNTKELKSTLLRNGFEIKTHSDTEILLKSFIYYGYDVVNHLNGIFAFAI